MRAVKQIYSLDEYIELDKSTGEKFEFCSGSVWSMSGAGSSHTRPKPLTAAINLSFTNRFRILPEYILIAQHRPHVSQFVERGDGFRMNFEFNDLP